MTTVIIRKTSTSAYDGFLCMGHVGYAKFAWIGQKDILCSAVSVLVINTINALDELTDAKFKVTSNEKTGFIECQFVHPPDSQSALLMDAMILGLQNIQKQYGTKYLEVRFEEV